MKDMMFSKHNRNVTQRGFSLVELMVSLTIFAIVMTVSIGTLVVMIDANAKAQALYQAMTNISFAIDNISRNIRTAHTYHCAYSISDNVDLRSTTYGAPEDCSTGEVIIFTRERDNIRTAYRRYGTSIQQKEENGGWMNITSDDVKINTFDIKVSGAEESLYNYSLNPDTEQPEIEILVKGTVLNGLETETDFTLQTYGTQRILHY